MKETIPVEQAVGMVLPHDITEIRGGEFKGRAFKKGHIIQPADINHLRRLGKEHIFVLSLGADEIHENEAAVLLAQAIAGSGVTWDAEPVEGKIGLRASHDGLLKVDTDSLYRLNLLGEIMCATLHSNQMVKEGEQVAATRLIPLIGKRDMVRLVVEQTPRHGIVTVRPIKRVKAALVITGNEVFHGRIKDAFEPVLRGKLADMGAEVAMVRFAPDDARTIAQEIKTCLTAGMELVITSGGMSVDPDDVTRQGIKEAGVTGIVYGTPVLPGAMFLVGYFGAVPVLGLPACGMFHKITVFDLILPRVLTGDKITREEFAAMGHGGLCRHCQVCNYPICGFGR